MQYRQIGVSLDRLRELMPGAQPAELVRRRPSYLFGRLPEVPFVAKTGADRFEMLEVEGLTYVHPDSGRGVRDVDLRLQRGSFTVVTGRIGSGKTTLLRTLMGSLPKQAGEARWNGATIDTPDEFLTPPRCAYVSQVPRLFSEELRANILLGLPEREVDLDGAVTTAVMERDLEELEDGLETIVGPSRRPALRRPGPAGGGRAHVREGARAAGVRRRVQRAGRRDRADAVAARLPARRGDQPRRVPPPRGLPPRRPHRRPQGRQGRRGGQAGRPAPDLRGDAAPMGRRRRG